MRKLVDPLRLFDAKARPLSSYEAMEKRIALLEHQNQRLVRILKGRAMRSGELQIEQKPILH
jgi:hypothetical protein